MADDSGMSEYSDGVGQAARQSASAPGQPEPAALAAQSGADGRASGQGSGPERAVQSDAAQPQGAETQQPQGAETQRQNGGPQPRQQAPQGGPAQRPAGAPQQPQQDEWSDVGLSDILKGFGALIGMVSGAVETIGSAFQGPSYTRPVNPGSPERHSAGAPAVGVRDPVVELFDEGAELLLIVEWPYVEDEQIQVEAREDILCLSLGGEVPYSTEILLPGCVEPTPLSRSYRNGILEVRLRRI